MFFEICAYSGGLLLLVAIVLLAMRVSFIVFTVEGQSMSPTLEPGERVLVLRRWLARRFHRGQIVVIRRPRLATAGELSILRGRYIKRIVALKGEIFEARSEQSSSPCLHGEEQIWHVPQGSIFVCGD